MGDLESSSFDYEASLRACAKGNRDGLRMLFEQEAGRLLTVARRIVRRRDIAEEVVQEAFLRIWRKADQFDPRLGSARGWVYTIVRNRALDVIRDNAREELTDDSHLETLLHDERSVDDAFQQLAANSRLRHCLQMLDARRRTCLLLAYVAGFSHGEIAGRLGLPLGTAKSWIRRTVDVLKECLA